MKDMQKGKITEDELNNVKVEYLSILEETNDSMEGIIESYVSLDLLDLDDYETRKEMVMKVRIEDIINVSKKIHIDTVYLLKGAIHEKN